MLGVQLLETMYKIQQVYLLNASFNGKILLKSLKYQIFFVLSEYEYRLSISTGIIEEPLTFASDLMNISRCNT